LPPTVAAGGLSVDTMRARLSSKLVAPPTPELDPVRQGREALRLGDHGPQVVALQRVLRASGQTLVLDGAFGPDTQRAVRRVQAKGGLAQDGVVGVATMKVLDASVTTVAPKPAGTSATFPDVRAGAVLASGARSETVRALQTRLAERGYTTGADGVFGPGTEASVRRFQRGQGLAEDGRFGALSLAKLEALEAKLPLAGWADAWQDGRKLGRLPFTEIDGYRVEMKTAAAFDRMRKDAAQAGVRLGVESGFRTYQRQAELYDDYLAGVGNPANPPGWSNHQNGIALDLNTHDAGVFGWLTKNAGKYGFVRTVPSEIWHWEYRPR
jgi:peptidoglycan hydrolase-like protein with peptidoglycan-binding domain